MLANSDTPGIDGDAGPAGAGSPGGAGGLADGGTGPPSPGTGTPGAVVALGSAGLGGSTAASPDLRVLDQALAGLGNPDNPLDVVNAIALSGIVPTVAMKGRSA